MLVNALFVFKYLWFGFGQPLKDGDIYGDRGKTRGHEYYSGPSLFVDRTFN